MIQQNNQVESTLLDFKDTASGDGERGRGWRLKSVQQSSPRTQSIPREKRGKLSLNFRRYIQFGGIFYYLYQDDLKIDYILSEKSKKLLFSWK